MQDVTDLPFWRVMHRYGGPDIYFTEYFRVYETSRPESKILRCIRENPSERPVIAQMIGQHIPSLIRTAKQLQKEKISGIDLNMGCPAPIVCKKSSGGGLLRHLDHAGEILTALRDAIDIRFTVKTRIGFQDPSEFEAILDLFAKHPIDALTVHGRTVKEMYRTEVHYDAIARAAKQLPCPVYANGNVLSAQMGRQILNLTGTAGLMIGRGAIRNPWIWEQIRELDNGGIKTRPTLLDLREYIEVLYRETSPPGVPEKLLIAKMKKYLNFIAQGISEDDTFLHQIRRAQTELEFFKICDTWLHSDTPFEPETPNKALINSGNPRTDCY